MLRRGWQSKTSKLTRLFLASVLVAVAILAVPPSSASAETALCRQCRLYGDCFACCVCNGGGFAYCLGVCP